MTAPREHFGIAPVLGGYVPELTRLNAVLVDVLAPIGGSTAGVVPTPQVPEGHWWRLLGGSSTIVTSATAGDRVVGVKAVQAGLLIFLAAGNVAIPASSTVQWSFGIGVGVTGLVLAGGRYVTTFPIPDVILPPGAFVTLTQRLSFAAPLFGDTWTETTLLVEDHMERPSPTTGGGLVPPLNFG